MAEKRQDINGRLVTRWVKPKNNTRLETFPAPNSRSASSPINKVMRRLDDAVKNQYTSIPRRVDMNVVEQQLHRLPKRTVDFVFEVMESNHADNYFDAMIISALHNKRRATEIEDVVYVYTMIDPALGGGVTGYERWYKHGFEGESIIREALRGCSRMEVEGFDYVFGSDIPLRLLGETTSRKVMALYNVVRLVEEELEDEAFIGYDDNATFLANDELAALIVDQHARNEEILHIIRERGTLDVEVLKLVLSATTRALQEGAL